MWIGRMLHLCTVQKAVPYMIVSSLGFSLMQLCVKFLSHLPTVELVFFRSLVSLILSLVTLYKLGIHPMGNNRKFLVLRGLFGATALSLFFYTLQNLPIATAITIQYLSPIFTAIFAIFILGEKMKSIQWVFFTLAFAGVAVIKGFNSDVSLKYLLAGVTSAVFAGLAYNMIRRVKDTDHPVVVVFYFPLIAIPIMGALSLFNWVTPHGKDWLILILMGIFTQIAQVYMTKAWQSDTANRIAPLKYIGIIFALSFDFFLFDIVPSFYTFIGILLVVGGVVFNLFASKKA